MFTLPRLFFLAALTLALPVFAETKTEPPVPVRTIRPEYPKQLYRDGVAGVVTIKCSIDEHGNVVATEVVKSSHEAFEKPAVDAVSKWKFKPARQDGTAIAMKVSIPIKFVNEG